MTNVFGTRIRRGLGLLLLGIVSLSLPACGSGAVTGAAIGAAFGAAIGSTYDDDCGPYDDCYYYKAGDPALGGTF